MLASGRGSNFEALCRGDTGSGSISLLLSDNPEAQALRRASALGVEAIHVSPGGYRTKFDLAAEEEWAGILREKEIDLVCLAGLMRILKGPLLTAYEGRIMNIHPSLLPSFPGLSAQKQALDYGVKVSGCTVHYVDPGVDTGPVILQRTVPVLDGDDVESLSNRILQQEHQAYPLAVRLHCQGRLRIAGRRVMISGTDGEK